MKKNIFYFQTGLLALGSAFAWSNVFRQSFSFISEYGTLLRFKDCSVPNPLLTACVYGSLAFLAALAWSIKNLYSQSEKSQRYLRNFLLFCVLFALSVVFLEAADYFRWFKFLGGNLPVSCTPGVHPAKTPCFTGLIFFTASFIASIFTLRGIRKLNQ